MICKWCGNSMETRETVCRRCGKEVPAKSDCGGFYDLVPDAQGIVPPVLLQPSTQKKTAKKSGLAVFLGLLCCILVVVTVVTAVSGNSAKKEAARLEEQLRVATEYEEVLLNQQKFKTVLRLDENKEEETYSMKVDSDLPGSVVVKCTPTGKKGIVGYSTELVVPNEKNGVVKLQLDQDPKKEELTLQMELGKTFGRLDNVGCTLFYVAEDGSLVKLEKEPPAEGSKTTEEEPKPTEEDVKEQEIIELIRAKDERGMDALLVHYGPLMRYVAEKGLIDDHHPLKKMGLLLLVQVVFFPRSALLGASGIVFMLIVLSSLSGMSQGTIPLTFLLVAVIYLGQEVSDALTARDNISQLTHIVGGVCGGVLGMSMRRK